jgi:hypothetical protein
MSSLYILGTGMLAEEFFALAQTSDVTVEAFVENLDHGKIGASLCGRPIIGVEQLPRDAACVCALSTTDAADDALAIGLSVAASVRAAVLRPLGSPSPLTTARNSTRNEPRTTRKSSSHVHGGATRIPPFELDELYVLPGQPGGNLGPPVPPDLRHFSARFTFRMAVRTNARPRRASPSARAAMAAGRA